MIRQKIEVLCFLGALLFLQACGQTTALESELSGTEWAVIDMTGFPSDVITTGSFRLTSDTFFYFDGANTGSSPIDWSNIGFDVTDTGTSTTAEAGPRYLSEILGGPGDSVTIELAGNTLTLTRGDLSVTAGPGTLGS